LWCVSITQNEHPGHSAAEALVSREVNACPRTAQIMNYDQSLDFPTRKWSFIDHATMHKAIDAETTKLSTSRDEKRLVCDSWCVTQ